MAGDISEDARERADAEVRVVGDRHVMFAALLGRESHVAARLSRDGVSVAAERRCEVAPGEIARQPHSLRRDDFIVDAMQSDHLRPVRIRLIEVTADGVADHLAELLEIIRFGDDRRADGVGDVPALVGVLDDEEDLGHGETPGKWLLEFIRWPRTRAMLAWGTAPDVPPWESAVHGGGASSSACSSATTSTGVWGEGAPTGGGRGTARAAR